jgi:hypothetical protein
VSEDTFPVLWVSTEKIPDKRLYMCISLIPIKVTDANPHTMM